MNLGMDMRWLCLPISKVRENKITGDEPVFNNNGRLVRPLLLKCQSAQSTISFCVALSAVFEIFTRYTPGLSVLGAIV